MDNNKCILCFESLLSSDKIQGFDCGVTSLNTYLQSYASLNQNRHLSVTMLAWTSAADGKELVGYYTLCPAEVAAHELPLKLSRGLPKYPVPAIRLCRLAIDLKYQKKKYGRELLVHALLKSYYLSQEGGGFCVLVDAIDENAVLFYEHFGFIPLKHHPLCLFMPIKLITAYI